MKRFLIFFVASLGVFHAGAAPPEVKDGCGTSHVPPICNDLLVGTKCDLQIVKKGKKAPFHLVATNKQTHVQILIDSYNHNDSFIQLHLSGKLKDSAGKEIKSTGNYNKPHFLTAYCCNKDSKNDRSIVTWKKKNFSRQRLNIRWKRGKDLGKVAFWAFVVREDNKCWKIRSSDVLIKEPKKRKGEQNFSEFGNKK